MNTNIPAVGLRRSQMSIVSMYAIAVLIAILAYLYVNMIPLIWFAGYAVVFLALGMYLTVLAFQIAGAERGRCGECGSDRLPTKGQLHAILGGIVALAASLAYTVAMVLSIYLPIWAPWTVR